MNNIFQFARRFVNVPQMRSMAYIGHIDSVVGPLRYGCVDMMDYTGKKYLIPYTCTKYTDEIDDIINNIVCDIPPEEYNKISHIVECMVNKTLYRKYTTYHYVRLFPSAKNMLPPCLNVS